MHVISRHPEHRLNFHRWSQVALRMVLMVTLWQGPIPVWHSHGTLKNSAVSTEMFSWFTGHLRSSHAAVDPAADVEFGWHAHFDWPRIPVDSDSPDQLNFATEFCAVSAACTLPWNDSAEFQYGFSVETLTDRALGGDLVERPLGFYVSFATSLAVPVRFGVVRC